MLTRRQIAAAAWRAKRDRRGIASIEFAMIAGTLITILLGVYDIGDAVQQRMVMEQALRAGAIYALSFPTQSAGITQAIQASLQATWPNGWSNVTVSPPTVWYTCTGSTTPVAVSTGCGGSARAYVTLSMTRPYTPYLLTLLTGNTVSYVVRVQ